MLSKRLNGYDIFTHNDTPQNQDIKTDWRIGQGSMDVKKLLQFSFTNYDTPLNLIIKSAYIRFN